MSNEFLHSSPSRHLIDPIIYNSLSDVNHDDKTNSQHQTQLNQNNQSYSQPPSMPQSASKFYSNAGNFPGWTPMMSKTIFNEQLMSYNSTPNRYAVSHSSSQDIVDYSQGLNLTPFLNHNINIISSNASNQQLHNITPFHDKSLHLTDFFMDSPIKQTPIKDMDTITPSKFKVGSERRFSKQSILQDPKSVKKRSVTQSDTPQRQPHKLSITTKADKDEDDKEENEVDYDKFKAKYYLQTPSKRALHDISNFTKTSLKSTPLKNFQTPAKPIQNSSPSTVIMSSALKGSPKDSDKQDRELNQQPSPTPKKELNLLSCEKVIDGGSLKPAMGVFLEKKSRPLSVNQKSTTFKNLLTTTANTTTATTTSITATTNSTFTSVKSKASNKAQMQAGMNKFQIVFTDVHTLMNNKNKAKKLNVSNRLKRVQSISESNESKIGKRKGLVRSATAPITQQYQPRPHNEHQQEIQQAQQQTPPLPVIYQPAVQPSSSSASSSQDHNTTINTSKEISIISGNSSNLSVTSATDHSSFELGGVSSTPNRKYFLDKIFDKPSPQSQQLWNQANQFYFQQQYGSMPPPSKQLSQHYQQQQQQQAQPPMMMMSTPQHQSIVHYGPNVYHPNNDASPSVENNTPYNGSNNSLTTFSYQTSHPYSKISDSPPQNITIVRGMNKQQVMVPMMINSKSTASQQCSSSIRNTNNHNNEDQEKLKADEEN